MGLFQLHRPECSDNCLKSVRKMWSMSLPKFDLNANCISAVVQILNQFKLYRLFNFKIFVISLKHSNFITTFSASRHSYLLPTSSKLLCIMLRKSILLHILIDKCVSWLKWVCDFTKKKVWDSVGIRKIVTVFFF